MNDFLDEVPTGSSSRSSELRRFTAIVGLLAVLVSIAVFADVGRSGTASAQTDPNPITFSEYPVNTVINTQYMSKGARFGPNTFITGDQASPTSPVLSGSPRFFGPIRVDVVDAGGAPRTAIGFSMDVGYVDLLNGVKLTYFDSSGQPLGSIGMVVGINHVNVTQSGVASILIENNFGAEPAGFEVDNVLIRFAPGTTTTTMPGGTTTTTTPGSTTTAPGGSTTSTTTSLPPTTTTVPPAPPVTATEVTVGWTDSCALLTGGSVKCWGSNLFGQSGLGDTVRRGGGPASLMGDALPAVDLGYGRTAIALSAGGYRVCALLDNGAVKCWGLNSFGVLGQGDTADRGDQPGEMGVALPAVQLGAGRRATALASGTDHTCALLDNGTVKCWGANLEGELGIGDKATRGDGPGEMGDALPAVALGTGRTARAIAAGANHTCALLDDASVKCWGYNGRGQLGLGSTLHKGDDAGEMGDALPAVALGSGRTASAIFAGGDHTCALLDNGALKCWGANFFGQLGQGDTTMRGEGPGEMGDALPAIDLGTGRRATAVAAGFGHTCAILDDNHLKCWGQNLYGQLGLGVSDYRGDGPGEMGDALPAVNLGTGRTLSRADSDYAHTCVVLDNGRVKCWGDNQSGQLGVNDTGRRGPTPGSMGDGLLPVDLGTVSGPPVTTTTLPTTTTTSTTTLPTTTTTSTTTLPTTTTTSTTTLPTTTTTSTTTLPTTTTTSTTTLPTTTTTSTTTTTTSTTTLPTTTTTSTTTLPTTTTTSTTTSTTTRPTTTTTTPPRWDLQLSKTLVGNLSNGFGIYVLSGRNVGTGATSGTLTVVDELPTGLSYLFALGVTNRWSCNNSGQTVSCTYSATIAPGAAAPPILLIVAVTAPAGSTITNAATVTPLDATPANNTSTANCSRPRSPWISRVM